MFYKSHQKYVLFSCIDQVEEKKKRESFQRPSFREKRKYRKKEEEIPVTLSGTRKLFLFLIILFPIFLQILLPIL